MSIFIALLILSFLIFFHELGHFMAARFFGIHVEVFSIGFGKRLITKKIGATEFSLALIPLGGYVKMKGQDDLDPAKRSMDADSYNALRPWRRIVILLAGPFANFVLAFFLFITMALNTHESFGAKIGMVQPNSPAFHAGLKVGDIVQRVNDTNVVYWEEFVTALNKTDGVIALIIERNTTLQAIALQRVLMDTTSEFNEKIQKKLIGVQVDPNFLLPIDHSIIDSLVIGAERTFETSTMIFVGIQKLIEGIVPAKELGGVITIVDVTSKASEAGFMYLLFITALISVNLGVLNLLPIPALDGGHVMFNLYEMITRHVPSERAMITITIMGWILLLSLMSLGLYNDIVRIIERD